MGVGTAVRLLQAALGAPADGVVGPATLAAARRADPGAAITRLGAERRARYRALAGFDAFGAGWLRRVDEVTAQALAQSQAAAWADGHGETT
jgi:lysozyme family protein